MENWNLGLGLIGLTGLLGMFLKWVAEEILSQPTEVERFRDKVYHRDGRVTHHDSTVYRFGSGRKKEAI